MASGAPEADAQEPAKPGISEKLAKRLSAHRTAALQAEVARLPEVALVAVVHRLALRLVCDGLGAGDSPMNIDAKLQDGLDTHAPDIAQSPAAMALQEARQAWTARLPDWLAIPDDVKAGIFEEIVELHPQGAAEQHWAWSFVRPFLIAESGRAP